MPLRRILCPIDFSDCSRRALDFAVMLAPAYGSYLDVAHVHCVTSADSRRVDQTSGSGSLSNADRGALLQTLAEWVAAGRAKQVSIDTWVEEGANAAEVILARAAMFDSDLILLGAHGQSGFQRLVVGSTTDKVLRRAPCSVLIVPASKRTAPQSLQDLQRIVCGIEFSTASACVWRTALSLARHSTARLTAMHVLELPPDVPEPPLPAFQESRAMRFHRARVALDEIVTARARALCPIDELLLVGKPYREVLRVASDQQADLIVLGANTQDVADTRFLGSTTEHVARACECPLLVVRRSRVPDDIDAEAGSAIDDAALVDD